MKDMPEGFPLPPIDAEGNRIKEGDVVRIDTIPDSLVADYLDDEGKRTVRGSEGKEMIITEIDEYGFVWVEVILLQTEDQYNTHSFSMEPKHITKVR
jgi:hypothetical protein